MKNRFEIRLANLDDSKNIFDLSQDETIRKDSIHRIAFNWKEHTKWFSSRIKDEDCLFYVAYEGENFLGYVRLDKEKEFWNVSIHIKPSERGRGIAKEFLFEVRRQNRDKKLSALIKNSNEDTYALFLRSDFKFDGFKYIDDEKYRKMKLFPKNVIVIDRNLFKDSELCGQKNVIYIESNNELAIENLTRINPEFVFFTYWTSEIPKAIYEQFDCITFELENSVAPNESAIQNLIKISETQTKIFAVKYPKTLDNNNVYLEKELSISDDLDATCKKMDKTIAKMIDEIISKTPEETDTKSKKETLVDISSMNDLEQIYKIIKAKDKQAFLEHKNLKFELSDAKLKDEKIIAKVEIKKI